LLVESRPNWDYLLPAEALSDLNWECVAPSHVHLKSPNTISTFPPRSEEDWLLHGDIDVAIGVGNDDIRNSQQHDSDATESYYYSIVDKDSNGYEWEDDAEERIVWPLEMLHAPSSSSKWPCKRKAPN
jgi:hypothetical protein